MTRKEIRSILIYCKTRPPVENKRQANAYPAYPSSALTMIQDFSSDDNRTRLRKTS